MSTRYDLFAVTAHGLGELCARELADLGVEGKPVQGGVEWRGTAESMYRANLELRTASRVIARVGEFRARGFPELERRAARLPWLEFLQPGAAVRLRVTCRKSRLYHDGAVAERVARVLADVAGISGPERAADDDLEDDAHASAAARHEDRAAEMQHGGAASGNSGPGAQLIIVRFLRDVCTISIDSSGALLHQRGYRQAIAKAPLRETIAAAMVLASGWRRAQPLIDPLCGSGTIPIEAALLARCIAPGIARPDFRPRRFAFETWPQFDVQTWNEAVTSAQNAVRDAVAPIVAADRDAGAINAARANAERAGVAGDVEFRHADLDRLEPVPGTGHVVTNPPYGIRVGEAQSLRRLYALLGSTVTNRLPGWRTTILAADDALAAATKLPLEEILTTRNGGIHVRLLTTPSAVAAGTDVPAAHGRPGDGAAAEHSPDDAVYNGTRGRNAARGQRSDS